MTASHTIRILPSGRVIEGKHGQRLLDALADNAIMLRSDCGGKGICNKCRVFSITPAGEEESIRSCGLRITEDLTIRIPEPESAMLPSTLITKAPVSFPASFARGKKQALADGNYGVAVDLGTTTIAVYLCNRSDKTVLSSISMKNPQALYGDDVMSRISAIAEDKCRLPQLQKMVVKAIDWGTMTLLDAQSLAKTDIAKVVVVGNPTMIHILSGVDPRSIGLSPYWPAFFDARTIDSGTIGLDLNRAPLITLSQISGFIGGDILGAALAVDLENQPDGTLLADIGTNGELLFKAQGTLFAASCATGPAFEGACLSCGMQAVSGAIARVSIENRLDFPGLTIIHSEKTAAARGICGTGVLSGVAELWRNRLVTSGGAFINNRDVKPLERDMKNRLRYTLAVSGSNGDRSSVFISQKDVRSVQLGKAALITGIEFLSRSAGFKQPKKIMIAGAFGSHMDKKDLITIGMLPDMDPEKIEIAGNAAGAGAVMVLCEEEYLKKSIEMAKQITTVELVADKRFQEMFIKNLEFPGQSL